MIWAFCVSSKIKSNLTIRPSLNSKNFFNVRPISCASLLPPRVVNWAGFSRSGSGQLWEKLRAYHDPDTVVASKLFQIINDFVPFICSV